MMPHYLVKIEAPKMHVKTSSPFNAEIKKDSSICLYVTVKNQRIFMLFSLLDSLMIGTSTDRFFTHCT